MFANHLLGTDDGEFIAIENEGTIGPDSQSVIKTVPKLTSNNTDKYRGLNHGVYVGEWSATPIVQNSVEMIIHKLR